MADQDKSKPPLTPYPAATPAVSPERQRELDAEQKKRADEAREAAERGVDERAEAMNKQNEEKAEREAKVKPTPTQRENDLAKVGALDIDSKEDDGSGPDYEHQKRVMEGRLPGGSPYETRNAAADKQRKK